MMMIIIAKYVHGYAFIFCIPNPALPHTNTHCKEILIAF